VTDSDGHEAAREERAPAGGVSPSASGERSGADRGSVSEQSELAELAREQVEADLDELSRVTAERDEYLDTLRRLQADFENYRKRMLKEQTALVERASQSLIEELLPVLDSFDLALANIDPETNAQVRKGVELVYSEFFGVLEKAGLSRIEALGKPFNPEEHEAMWQEDGEGEPVVSEVVRTGYRLKGRILRPALVKVTRAS
jgi:molecular chaperone GrpE